MSRRLLCPVQRPMVVPSTGGTKGEKKEKNGRARNMITKFSLSYLADDDNEKRICADARHFEAPSSLRTPHLWKPNKPPNHPKVKSKE